MNEDIQKAIHSLQLTEDGLRDALANCEDGVAAIILVDLLTDTCRLKRRAEELFTAAKNSD